MPRGYPSLNEDQKKKSSAVFQKGVNAFLV